MLIQRAIREGPNFLSRTSLGRIAGFGASLFAEHASFSIFLLLQKKGSPDERIAKIVRANSALDGDLRTRTRPQVLPWRILLCLRPTKP